MNNAINAHACGFGTCCSREDFIFHMISELAIYHRWITVILIHLYISKLMVFSLLQKNEYFYHHSLEFFVRNSPSPQQSIVFVVWRISFIYIYIFIWFCAFQHLIISYSITKLMRFVLLSIGIDAVNFFLSIIRAFFSSIKTLELTSSWWRFCANFFLKKNVLFSTRMRFVIGEKTEDSHVFPNVMKSISTLLMVMQMANS